MGDGKKEGDRVRGVERLTVEAGQKIEAVKREYKSVRQSRKRATRATHRIALASQDPPEMDELVTNEEMEAGGSQ